jgi:prepilin-type N-terminal cleavage/methylation domain-containing protein
MGSRQKKGFTLVELMVTIAVFLVLAVIAVPSFISFRQRSAIRAAGEQSLGVWNQIRFEALKHNSPVKFGVRTSGSNFCLGARPATQAEVNSVRAGTAVTACDCFFTSPATDDCTYGAFPASPAEWRGVTLQAAPTLGVGTSGVTIIDPKKTALIASGDAGNITLIGPGPSGAGSYKINMHIDRFGRGVLCQSTTATDKLSDYTNRNCAD